MQKPIGGAAGEEGEEADEGSGADGPVADRGESAFGGEEVGPRPMERDMTGSRKMKKLKTIQARNSQNMYVASAG